MIAKHIAIVILTLVVASLLQATVAAHIAIRLARPDFITIAISCLALLTGFGRGIAAGLWGGLLFAALCGANFGSFMVSRGAVGGLIGLIPRDIQRDNIYLPLVSVVAGTFCCEVVYFIMAPVSPVGWWAKSVITQALYNAVLTLPVYWLLSRILPKPANKYAFAPHRR